MCASMIMCASCYAMPQCAKLLHFSGFPARMCVNNIHGGCNYGPVQMILPALQWSCLVANV